MNNNSRVINIGSPETGGGSSQPTGIRSSTLTVGGIIFDNRPSHELDTYVRVTP